MKKFLLKIISWPKKHWKLSLLIVGLLGFALIIISKQLKQSQPQLNFVHPQVETITQTLEVSGVVDAKEKATMRFIAGGKLVYLGVQEGDWVKKWQSIASIDRASLQKSQEKYLNNYMKERWDWDQLGDDTQDRWLPKDEERDVDQAQWDLENTVLDVEIQSIAIANTNMSAPFAGLVTHTPAQTTGVVLLATDYFELINPATLYFKAQIDEEDLAKIKLGQSAVINLDAYTDETISTQLDYISYKASQTTSGTVFEVNFPLNHLADQMLADNDSSNSATKSAANTKTALSTQEQYQNMLEKYRLGMNGDIAIQIAQKENVLTIPILATTEVEGKVYVELKTEDGSTRQQEIKVGLETEEKVEVLEGLSVEDEIVLPE